MILALSINILELLTIVYLLWLLYEQVMKNEHSNNLLECAVKEIEKIRDDKCHWYNQYYLEHINNVREIRKYKKILKDIVQIVKDANNLPCTDFYANCENCKDETTDNGETCMRKGLKRILKVIGK